MTATLYDFRDVDLLFKLEEEADDEGFLETAFIAQTLGLKDDHVRNVAIRLAWMRRYGMVERDEQRGLWRITPAAQRVLKSRVKAATARQIEALDDEAMVEVMASVTVRYQRGSPMLATMLKREFAFGTQPGMRRNGRRR